MYKKILLYLTLTLIALLATTSYASAITFQQRTNLLLKKSGIAKQTAVYVWDQQNNSVIYQHNASNLLTPASTMKLLTGSAALTYWGADHRFQTKLLATGHKEGDAWLGSVYLVGGGDPMLSTAGYAIKRYGSITAATNISSLIFKLKAQGIKSISGRLVVDDSRFDTMRWASSWPSRFRLQQAGALGALTLNQSNTLYPERYAGSTLKTLLAKSGISVNGGIVTDKAPQTAIELAELQSPPLIDIVSFMSKTSDNFIAEILLKNLGAEAMDGRSATTLAGSIFARKQLASAGVDVSSLRWVDGSGLSYLNKVSPRLLGDVLSLGEQASWGDVWVDGLAISGTNGTLKKRMRTWPFRGRVHAKTGTLNHVSALAGFSDRTTSNHRYGFAIITDSASKSLPISKAHWLQDQIAMSLVR